MSVSVLLVGADLILVCLSGFAGECGALYLTYACLCFAGFIVHGCVVLYEWRSAGTSGTSPVYYWYGAEFSMITSI